MLFQQIGRHSSVTMFAQCDYFLVETLQKLCNKLDNLEDKIENLSNIEMTKRLGKLEEKVDNLIEKFEMSQKDYEHKMEKEIYEPKPKQFSRHYNRAN